MPRESAERHPSPGDRDGSPRQRPFASSEARHAAEHAARVASAEASIFVTHWTRLLHEDWLARETPRRHRVDASEEIRVDMMSATAGSCIPNLVITWPHVDAPAARPGLRERLGEGMRAATALARRIVQRWREQARARAMRTMLNGLDDRSLRDLGIDRDGIEWAAAAAAAATSEPHEPRADAAPERGASRPLPVAPLRTLRAS